MFMYVYVYTYTYTYVHINPIYVWIYTCQGATDEREADRLGLVAPREAYT